MGEYVKRPPGQKGVGPVAAAARSRKSMLPATARRVAVARTAVVLAAAVVFHVEHSQG